MIYMVYIYNVNLLSITVYYILKIKLINYIYIYIRIGCHHIYDIHYT